ncbi:MULTISPECIES: DDE-type integrase/transposase/recombinase [Porphyromonas]|uniref:DDE-type integrase/transposase/recombinase n=1 Tax=Porphyromonas TaxID=836 RepID=UPI000691DC65|nr:MULTISPECIES: DDE-type integrase/transposase/recombinase [Porphyromonas]
MATKPTEQAPSFLQQDVERSIDQAMLKAGLTHKNAPKLLSDNGPCYIANALKEHLSTKFNMKHIHGKPLHPQTQGKIERYLRSMRRVIKLQ